MENEPENPDFDKSVSLDTRLTSVNITTEDWLFCKRQRLQFSQLLRERICQLRAIDSGAIVENVQEERRKKENFMFLCEKQRDFMEKEGILNKFLGMDD